MSIMVFIIILYLSTLDNNKNNLKEKDHKIKIPPVEINKKRYNNNLSNYLSNPSEIVDVSLFLCECLNAFTKGVKDQSEIINIYPKALEAYNMIGVQRWHKRKFTNSKASVCRFCLYAITIYVNNYEALN